MTYFQFNICVLKPGGTNLVKLNTNENPYPPSPRIAEALAGFAMENLHRYPDPTADALRDEMKEQERQLGQLYEYYGAILEEKYGSNPYETVEAFGYAYYDLEGSPYSDVYEYLKKEVVPDTVRQKLIVYYIAEAEGWRATEEEYETELPKQLTYYAENEGVTTAEVLKKYGEEFFRQAIQYNKVLTNLVEVTVIE